MTKVRSFSSTPALTRQKRLLKMTKSRESIALNPLHSLVVQHQFNSQTCLIRKESSHFKQLVTSF